MSYIRKPRLCRHSDLKPACQPLRPQCTGAACSMLDPALDDTIDSGYIQSRALHYAERAGASTETVQRLKTFLEDPLTLAALSLPTQQLHLLLVNDLYKYRMHQVYSKYMTGVTADFALNIRKCSGQPPDKDYLRDLQEHHPQVYDRLLRRLQAPEGMAGADPLHPLVVEVLQEYAEFTPSKELLARSKQHGVGPVQAGHNSNGHASFFASGTMEAASNVETTCMQAVQEALIAAQVQKVLAHQQQQQQQGDQSSAAGPPLVFDRSERLANSLGKMVATVERLNALPHTFDIVLMAGRRSTDLAHLLLQNLYMMHHCRGYTGTSSVMALALLHPLLVAQGTTPQRRTSLVGRLMGTHAHEMTSMVQQLLVEYDATAGRLAGLEGPVCITQLLAPLLFLAANGDSGPASATSLSDTFTTAGFLAAALAADVPQAFCRDMADQWGWDIPAGSKVFDVFRVWRLDSGDYATVASAVVEAWEQRCQQREAAGLPPLPRPLLMHSNLSSVEEVQEVLSLPDRIRPASLGFGGLTDGYLPFEPPGHAAAAGGAASPDSDSESAQAQQPPLVMPCSLVMKAVQARLGPPPAAAAAAGSEPPGASSSSPAGPEEQATAQGSPRTTSSITHGAAQAAAEGAEPLAVNSTQRQLQASAVKLGDDPALTKVQTDPRLPKEAQQQAVQQMKHMVKTTAAVAASKKQEQALSQVLEEAYVAVVKQGCLQASAVKK